MPKVEFVKERFFKGKKYSPGDVITMNMVEAKVYINAMAAKYYKKPPKTKDPEKMGYKQLQMYCKKYELKAVGSKEELISQLKEKGVFK